MPTMNSSASDIDDVSAITWNQYIWIYTLPVIFLVGVFGNILTILVMHRERMRGTATSVYLTLMAVADTAVLVTGMIPEWLIQTRIKDIAEIHQWLCKFERFLFYTSGDVAIWILVAFTCDRCIAVCFPFKKREYCTPRRAYLTCLIILIVAFVKNLHIFWTRGVVYKGEEFIENCGKPQPYTSFEKKIRPWIVMVLVSLGPFIIIFVCNVMIIRQLLSSRRMRHSTAPVQQRAFTQTTAMCMSTSFAFLILITPSIVLLIGKPYWTNSAEPNMAYDIAKAVNNQLMFLNHSINFCLYCLTGARFREELVNMFKRRHSAEVSRPPRPRGRLVPQYSLSTSKSSDARSSPVPETPQFIRPGKGRSKAKKNANTNGDVTTQNETDNIIDHETVT